MKQEIHGIKTPAGTRPSTGWIVVAQQELRDLWLGTRGLTFILAYSVVLSVSAFLIAGNSELNFLDTRESIGIFVQVAMSLGTLAALVISADAISGERERGTLEQLLLTPISRRDLVFGKLLRPLTVWVASAIVAIPYMLVLAGGTGLVADAVLVLWVPGTLVAVALTSMGLAVSSVSGSNRASLIIVIMILLALAVPSQLPAPALRGALGDFLILPNPVAAGLTLAGRTIVDQATWASQWKLLIAPAVSSIFFTLVALACSRKLVLGGAF
ncbi:MAG TPA: ABC transporter permease subunit [Dehalococcoidia bacterium]|nr:ABC transporter permease subunit [Dehalococcoidia bacterium]